MCDDNFEVLLIQHAMGLYCNRLKKGVQY